MAGRDSDDEDDWDQDTLERENELLEYIGKHLAHHVQEKDLTIFYFFDLLQETVEQLEKAENELRKERHGHRAAQEALRDQIGINQKLQAERKVAVDLFA